MRTFCVPNLERQIERRSRMTPVKTTISHVVRVLAAVAVTLVIADGRAHNAIDVLSIAFPVFTVAGIFFGWLVPGFVYDAALRTCAQTEAELQRVQAHTEANTEATDRILASTKR